MRKVYYISLTCIILFIVLFSIKAFIGNNGKNDGNAAPQIKYSISGKDAIIPINTAQTSLASIITVTEEIQKEKSFYLPDSKVKSNCQGALNIFLYDRLKPLLLSRNILSDKDSNSLPEPYSI